MRKSIDREARAQLASVERDVREQLVNAAPITAGSAPLQTSAEALRTLRQNKHNPLPGLKPEMLARVLDQFERGYLRECVTLWEKIAERDDVIASVKPKREKDVSQLDMKVTATPGAGDAAEAHKQVLEDFWRNVRAVDAYDRNVKGGFKRLVKQMMTAVSYRYAAHHIVWEVKGGELRATFEFVPLWMFENRTGTLRYLPSASATEGKILDDGEWMVTVGDGLMIACCIGYLAKRSAFNDWLIFSEKFSVPGVLGRTTAATGSPEAQAMRDAVESFGHDWVAVITGDDGTHGEPIKLVQAQGSPQGMPMPAVIERVDRKFAALYRGADLSSMSSGASSEGTGASLQDKETDILRRDDAETIAETLEQVSRWVIEWHFGDGTEPLAKVELIVPVQEDTTKVLAAAESLADRGAQVSSTALADRLGVQLTDEPADALGKAKTEGPGVRVQGPGEELHNSLPDAGDALHEIRRALAADLQPLGEALEGALKANDRAAMRAALKKISERMPELLTAPATTEAMSGLLMKSFLSDSIEEMANSYDPNQPRDPRGSATGGRWTRVKARRLKKGIKVGDELYNRDNPAPPELALNIVRDLAEEPSDVSNLLSEMGHKDWLNTVPGASAHRDELLRRLESAKNDEATRREISIKEAQQKLGLSEEQIKEVASETTAYTSASVKEIGFDHLVFRGEDAPPVMVSARQAGGDLSRISESQYPVVELSLSNGSKLYEKIRISNHGQVSPNAPRHYAHDYRGTDTNAVFKSPAFVSDMNDLAAEVWAQQQAAAVNLTK